MLNITWKKKSLKGWWLQKLREAFVHKEVEPGRIVIVWRDVDNMVYGWNMSADEESGLLVVAAAIAAAKHKKLVHTVNGKGGNKNGKR